VLGQPLKGQGQDEMPINEGNADFWLRINFK
jgi:hypothetical protein